MMLLATQHQQTVTKKKLIKDMEILLTANKAITWHDFLDWTERLCALQGWDVEYHLDDDYSCAIFADEQTIDDQKSCGQVPTWTQLELPANTMLVSNSEIVPNHYQYELVEG